MQKAIVSIITLQRNEFIIDVMKKLKQHFGKELRKQRSSNNENTFELTLKFPEADHIKPYDIYSQIEKIINVDAFSKDIIFESGVVFVPTLGYYRAAHFSWLGSNRSIYINHYPKKDKKRIKKQSLVSGLLIDLVN